MRRREFITLVGGAVATWPVVARGQQAAMPVIGFLNNTSAESNADFLRAFRQGLKDTGYVEGENVTVEYRWSENQLDRLATMAADLVRRRVAVIASSGPAATFAAKTATATIPIVFGVADDPVKLGLVTSLARPDRNLTGVNFLFTEVTAKRLELLRELLPAATRLAVLVNPTGPNTEATVRDVQAVAPTMGLQTHVLNAGTSGEINATFATFVRDRPDALFVGNDIFLTSRRVQLVHLATLHKVPATYPVRQYPEAGGLMSYGASLTDAFRQIGVYSGRILKGAKPSELPVERSSKLDLVINAETARMLGITVPPSLLARADEVIE